jgi:L-alanine-DL-glutamate epimerase-like enolase superfamily enzyme
VTGRGEAAPLPGYDGVTLTQVREALESCRAVLEQGGEREDLLARCSERIVIPQALAAVDLALWDLAGQRAGEPVWRLLGTEVGAPIEVNATIAAEDRGTAAALAGEACAAGFSIVKVKVGIGDDAGRVAAVRAAGGSALRIRLDANGAWSTREAVANLRVLAPAGLELCEEPVRGTTDARRLFSQSPIATALDESAAESEAFEARCADAICLKLARCGGISGVVEAARRARAVGYEVYLASTLDGPLGIAAALHAAAAIGPDRPCGLATLSLLDLEDRLAPRDGWMHPPDTPGLGSGLDLPSTLA